ncbi:ferredoxin [Streptomyces sp. 4N124]|uniref:ferredoxin n=1 Tax=Streptomyces sp. 4N124 TaxID=3457420 RepID=UPI003FD44702
MVNEAALANEEGSFTVHTIVDEGKCCGTGQCVHAAPDVFDQREESSAVFLLGTAIAADRLTAMQQAAALYPAAAIDITE